MSNPTTPLVTGAQSLLSAQIPYSQEAEEAVIVNPDAFLDVASFLTTDDFYILRHAYLWEAMARVVARNEPLDYLTLQEELRALNRLSEIGGPAYLTQLINSIATSMHAEVYGRLVQRAAIRRRLLAFADEARGLALDEELDTEQVLAEAEARFLRVRDRTFDGSEETWSRTMGRIVEEVEQRMLHPDQVMGVPSGYRAIDDLLCGWQRTDFIVLAGRHGSGKTSLLLSYALNALRLGARVGLFSQEMNRDQVAYRFAAMDSGINLQKLRMGRLDQKEWSKFVRASGRVAALPFEVEDATRMTPTYVRTNALRWRRRHGLDLVLVDYLQILSSGGLYKGHERVQEVGYFAREMKQIARELKLPLMAAAQLSRAVEERQDKRPQLSDLRESGEIEQEADIVHFLYRDVMYNEATEFPNRADIIVAKHRNGPTGTVPLHFEKTTTHFSDHRTQTIDLSGLDYGDKVR